MRAAALPLLLPLFVRVAAAPCDATIGAGRWWQHAGDAAEVMSTAWLSPRVFSARLGGPGDHWTTMNATLSAGNATCEAVFSNGHRSAGAVSPRCDEIRWSDGSAWAALAGKPPVNVHISPHTHDDEGWGQTYLQYMYGTGPYGPEFRNATKIFAQVVAGLLADPRRRFAYAEMGFFVLWFEAASQEMQAAVRGLVASRQLVFLNGAWSMADEACTSYVDLLDNLATGHRGIAAHFGASALPTLAWSIDPFGHSATTGVLSSPASGFQGVMWGREPADFKAACRPRTALERVWLPSPSLGSAAATFAGTFFDSGYDWPTWTRCTLTGNVSACARAQGVADGATLGAAEIAGQRAPAVRGNDVLINMGTDWSYQNVREWRRRRGSGAAVGPLARILSLPTRPRLTPCARSPTPPPRRRCSTRRTLCKAHCLTTWTASSRASTLTLPGASAPFTAPPPTMWPPNSPPTSPSPL